MQESYQESTPGFSVFNLTIEGFKQLQTYGIDLNHLFILECLVEGTDIEKHVSYSKVKAWKQNLYRKSLMTEKGEVTPLGKELLTALKSPNPPRDIVKRIKKEADDTFELWWKIYPPTDMFTHMGKNFYGSRGLRQKKEECRKKFGEILLEGEHTDTDLIRALRREILLKMDQSVKDNENKMRYMQNSATYLNQRTYENFMYPKEDIRIGITSSTGAIDI